MAGKDQTIVIKKITIDGGAAHGGAWKVAFADFMTAMMCFFLVMWLLNQSEDVKKQVASYFSGPSMIEQQMTSYGAEITLEKLFLDMVNEPLKSMQSFMEPADFTPNLMAMGSKKIVLHEIAEELGTIAKDIEIDSSSVTFEIPDHYLFVPETADPAASFVGIMEKIKALTVGLEDSNIRLESQLYVESVPEESRIAAFRVAEGRLDLIRARIRGTLEHDTVDIYGKTKISNTSKRPSGGRPAGSIRITIEQKDVLSDGRAPRPLKDLFGDHGSDMSVYDDFVRRVGENPKVTRGARSRDGRRNDRPQRNRQRTQGERSERTHRE